MKDVGWCGAGRVTVPAQAWPRADGVQVSRSGVAKIRRGRTQFKWGQDQGRSGRGS